MLQWIGHRSKVEYDLIMRTFLQVFPDATLWNGGTLMAGTKRPLRVSRSAFERKLQDRADGRGAAGGRTDLLRRAAAAAYSGDAAAMRAFVGDGPVLTDDHPRIEYHRSLRGRDVMVDLGGFSGEGREQIEAP